MSFASLGLPDTVMRGVRAAGYSEPTPVQRRAIPVILLGHDVIAAAQTGSGKTAAFLLPIIARLLRGPRALRALVLVPTRELAAQVEEAARQYGRHSGVRAGAAYGGVPIHPQERMIRQGIELLVATPGRLLDLHGRLSVRLDEVEILVLDEADRMVDMGFAPDLGRILDLLPTDRQTLMFSATMPPELNRVARGALRNPRRLDLAPPSRPADSIEQAFYPVPRHLKLDLLDEILVRAPDRSAIVFTRTKRGADRVARQLGARRHDVAVLHGDRTQAQRERALVNFRRGRVGILVATDIASRGIDIDDITHVVNFDVPRTPEDYIHRIGRTGRMNTAGDALTLVSPEDEKDVAAIECFLGLRVERVTLEGFDYRRRAEPSERGGRHSRPPKRHGGDRANDRRHGGTRAEATVTKASLAAAPSGPSHGRRRRINAVGRRSRRRM